MTAETRARGRERTRHANVYKCHGNGCAWRDGGRCNCHATYEAGVWIARQGKLRRKRFPTLAAAKAWQEDSRGAVRAGKLRATRPTTVAEAIEAYLAGMLDGSIRDRSGERYKPATCRSYKRSYALRIRDELGRVRLDQLQRRDVLDLVDQLRGDGLADSTISNTLDVLRRVYARAVDREEVAIDPTTRIALKGSGRREHTVAPAQAEALIDALPASERALWATAIYCGLRRGELQELRFADLDLTGGVGHVERAYDDEGRCVVDVKTDAGRRLFPLVAPAKKRLIEHKLASGRDGDDLVFGDTATQRFVPSTVRRRALKAWKDAGLAPITLHEARHCAATAGSAAGLDDLVLAHAMGHTNAAFTRSQYGHVRLDHITAAAKVLDAYYAQAAEA